MLDSILSIFYMYVKPVLMAIILNIIILINKKLLIQILNVVHNIFKKNIHLLIYSKIGRFIFEKQKFVSLQYTN